jgi:hypothetical protein
MARRLEHRVGEARLRRVTSEDPAEGVMVECEQVWPYWTERPWIVALGVSVAPVSRTGAVRDFNAD